MPANKQEVYDTMLLKHVLVTGANGFIGQSLCKSLAKSGFIVRGTLRSLDRISPNSQTEYVATGPIEAVSNWGRVLDSIEAVVHTAATSDFHGPSTKAALDQMNSINVEAVTRLAEQAVAAGVKRFIYLSSIKVNGLLTTDRPFTADDKPHPVEPYGKSKMAAEQALFKISADTGLELIILRPGLVYGPNPRGSILQLMRFVDREIPLPLASVNNRRSLVAVQNLCDLIKVCLVHPKARNNTFLVSDGVDLSTPDLIRRIAGHMGRKTRLVPIPVVLLRLSAQLLGKRSEIQALTFSQQIDSSKTRDQLNWLPPVNPDEALGIAVEDYLRLMSGDGRHPH